MDGVMTWVCIIFIMLFAAGVWFTYLVRVVLNDEIVQEKRRRRMRARELERRKIEDRAAKRRPK